MEETKTVQTSTRWVVATAYAAALFKIFFDAGARAGASNDALLNAGRSWQQMWTWFYRKAR